MHRNFRIGISLFFSLGAGAAIAQQPITDTQPDQEALARQLRADQSRYQAFNEISAIPPGAISPGLRDALIGELERTNDLRELSRSTGIGFDTLESPEYVAKLQQAIAALEDPDTFPALVNGLGSFATVPQLADQGERVASLVLDVVTDPDSNYYAVDDGLVILRMMVENQLAQPLTSETLARIRDAAKQRLMGTQYFTNIWRAIDLAAVLDDSELDQRLELISSYQSEVLAFGVEDPELIKQLQRLAAEGLAGVPPKPRREYYPKF